MESLVKGASQEVSDGSILLALSAWHIYPDLIVLGTKTQNVIFADPLVRTGGALTIGLHFASENQEAGMQWSLTLSHLLYYGDPVQVQTYSDSQRVTIDELLLVALGGVFAAWETPAKEELAVARYLMELDAHLPPDTTSAGSRRPDFRYIRIMFKAAKVYLSYREQDPKECTTFVTWVAGVPNNSLVRVISLISSYLLYAPRHYINL
jgi:hypothetical protein